MGIDPGSQLGAYQIVAPLGAGGMGEVYRARDTRLDRDVAVKVLPARLTDSPDAFARFEREAKSVAALSHPNILAIHDFGTWEGTPFAVMELLEGETLRQVLARGPLPRRKVADLGVQVARGLAAAHGKGIVHRDLKPENLIVTPEGRVKILDFGLARQVLGGSDGESTTLPGATDPGTVLGTVGYMAPEQVRGQTADQRSDIFSLGCVLLEALTGRRAFKKDTQAETMTAILREDPLEGADLPVAFERTLRHCLEKGPAERFQTAQDLAFDLEALAGGSGERTGAQPAAQSPRPRRAGLWVVAAVASALCAGVFLGRRAQTPGQLDAGPEPEPVFTRLTFARGTVWRARFAPGEETVVYGAAWEGEPIRLFVTRLDSPESAPVGLPDASLDAISSTGELAVSLGHTQDGWMGSGTLARARLLGGTARPVLENVREADWSPDGAGPAIVRSVDGMERLEYPIGTVLYQTSGFVDQIRFSPRGDRIAFADHPLWADNVGAVAVVDLSGHKTTLTPSFSGGLTGIAWTPSGQEVWFTAARGGGSVALRAVDLSGRQRVVQSGTANVQLFDIAPSGRVLLGQQTTRRHVEALTAGATAPLDVTLAREESQGEDVSDDGRVVVLSETAAAGDQPYRSYLRRPGDPGPVLLGDGEAHDISADGRWVLATTVEEAPRILLHPVGTGSSAEIPNRLGLRIGPCRLLPDASGVVVFAAKPGEGTRGWLIGRSGEARAFTALGVTGPSRRGIAPLSPDGTRVVGQDTEGRLAIYRLDGTGESVPLPPLREPIQDVPGWTEDGRGLLVARRVGTVWKVHRLDLATGRETPWSEIRPRELAGLRLSYLRLSGNGRYWVHSYAQLLVDLFLAEGLR